MTKTTAPSRELDIQTPGEAPKIVKEPSPTIEGAGTSKTPDIDKFEADDKLEALRAQIREEERAKLRTELNDQMLAASKAIEETVGNESIPRTKADYRRMRAADIDHTTLTAPVLTLDGYLCPPAPEAKK